MFTNDSGNDATVSVMHFSFMIIDYRTNVLLSRDIATGKEEIGEKGNRGELLPERQRSAILTDILFPKS